MLATSNDNFLAPKPIKKKVGAPQRVSLPVTTPPTIRKTPIKVTSTADRPPFDLRFTQQSKSPATPRYAQGLQNQLRGKSAKKETFHQLLLQSVDETMEKMVQDMHIEAKSPIVTSKGNVEANSPLALKKEDFVIRKEKCSETSVPETRDFKINCLEQELKQERELNASLKESNRNLKDELMREKDRIKRLESQVVMLEKMALL